MFNFLHTFSPQSILFQIGTFKIHWYGLLIAIGAVLSFLIVAKIAKKYFLDEKHVYNLAFWLIIFGLIGDRLYYVFYAWEYYSENLLDIFKIWQGGLAIHGAIIAGIITIFIYAKKNKVNSWLLSDLVVLGLPLAMAFGRWGNYFNQELFGKPTDLPWGIPIDILHRPTEYINYEFFHPTFLYESLGNIVIFLIILFLHKYRLKKQKTPEQIKSFGEITLVYLFLYSILRGTMEFLRLDFSPYFMGFRWAQFVSLLIILIVAIIFIIRRIRIQQLKR